MSVLIHGLLLLGGTPLAIAFIYMFKKSEKDIRIMYLLIIFIWVYCAFNILELRIDKRNFEGEINSRLESLEQTNHTHWWK